MADLSIIHISEAFLLKHEYHWKGADMQFIISFIYFIFLHILQIYRIINLIDKMVKHSCQIYTIAAF